MSTTVQLKVSELRTALRLGQLFLPRRQTLPVLSNIKLQFGEDSVAQVTATNLEAAFVATLPCASSEAFDILLPCRQALKFLSKAEGAVELKLAGKVATLTLPDVGEAKFSDVTLVSDYPAIPQPGEVRWTTLDAKWFLRLLKHVAIHTAAEVTRPILTGILFEDGAIVAADGFRLAAVKSTRLNFGFNGKKYNLPATTAQLAAKVFAELDEIEIAIDGKYFYFRGGNVLLTSQAIQGNFPDYRQLVPQSFDHQITFSVPVLLDRLSLFNGFRGTTKFSFHENNTCKISAKDDEISATYNIEMPAQVSSECRIALRKCYIEQAVKLFSLCTLQMTTLSSPVVFKGDIEELTILIMPMFIEW